MKRILALALSTLFILIAACDDDFDITADWKDITVVYGLLNQKEDIHYVKINRAFLGEGDALVMAAEKDSSTYAQKLDVWMEEYLNGTFTGRIIHFDTTSIYNKEEGIFYAPQQVVYYSTAVLNSDKDYRLKVNNSETGNLIEAETGLVKPFSITKPRAGQTLTNFAAPADVSSEVAWKAAVNGRLYQLVIRFHYYEKDLGTGQTDSTLYVDMTFGNQKSSGLAGSEELSETFPSVSFYKTIADKVEEKAGVERYPGPVEYIIYVGADDLSTYIDVSKPTNSIVQERPEYTNVSNGIGIFSARYSERRILNLNSTSKDSLEDGIYTRHLSFIKN